MTLADYRESKTDSDIFSLHSSCSGLNPVPLQHCKKFYPLSLRAPRSRHSLLLSSQLPDSTGFALSPNTTLLRRLSCRFGTHLSGSCCACKLAPIYPQLAMGESPVLNDRPPTLGAIQMPSVLHFSYVILWKMEPLQLQLFLISPFGFTGKVTQVLDPLPQPPPPHTHTSSLACLLNCMRIYVSLCVVYI